MKLKYKYHFDAAHRLEFHEGLCKNLHGHRWEVLITIISNSLEDIIIDFGDLKRVINEFDHATILKNCKENERLIQVLNEMGSKLILLVGSPTAENLSRLIYELIFGEIKNSDDIIDKLKVEVFESPNASISYNE